jgi:hypothetical protein
MAYFAGKYFSSQYWQADTWNVGEVSPPIISEAGVRSAGSGGKRRRIPMIRLPDGRMYVAETLEQFNRLYAAIEHKTGEPPIVMAPPVVVPPTKPREVPIVLASPPDADWRPIEDVVAELERLAEELEEDDTITLLMAA